MKNILLAFSLALSVLAFGQRSDSVTQSEKFISIQAKCLDRGVQLQFETINEVDVARFSIQGSNDGHSFQEVGTLKPQPGGKYVFTSFVPYQLYRIDEISVDGTVSSSKTLVARCAFKEKVEVPGVVKDSLKVKVQSPGRATLLTSKNTLVASVVFESSFVISTQGLAKGTYYLILDQKGVRTVEKVIKL